MCAAAMKSTRRVVVIGGGFGGAYAAQALGKLAHRHHLEVTLINRTNYFVFYPLLVEAGTGSLEPRHAVVPLRKMIDTPVRFVMAQVTGVDFEANTVTMRLGGENDERTIAFDHVVLAPGSTTMLPPVEGLADYGFSMKSMADAVQQRDRMIALLERAEATDDVELRRALLHIVVVGAAFTGVEVVGEYQAFLSRAAEEYWHLDPKDIRITLVEKMDRILPQLPPSLAGYAQQALQQRGVSIRLQRTIRRVAADHVELDNGEVLRTHTCLWTAGIQPPPLNEKFDLPKDKRGYVLCERSLLVRGKTNVWAIGDAAVNIDEDGNPYPATAQHAVQMGRFVAKNVLRVIDHGPSEARPFVYRSKGTLAALGCRTAVAEVMGMRLSGFVAWWLWRTVYLMKMPGWGRRVRIALDWTMDLLFGRDYVQLGIHKTKINDSQEQ